MNEGMNLYDVIWTGMHPLATVSFFGTLAICPLITIIVAVRSWIGTSVWRGTRLSLRLAVLAMGSATVVHASAKLHEAFYCWGRRELGAGSNSLACSFIADAFLHLFLGFIALSVCIAGMLVARMDSRDR